MIRIQKGLDIPIAGMPEQNSIDTKSTTQQAIIGFDYPGLKPSVLVEEGQMVKMGQALLSDKKNPGVIITSPGAGKVVAIHRGERRLFQSIVIESVPLTNDNIMTFSAYTDFSQLDAVMIREQLQQSGMWAAFRTRPYSKIPSIDSQPSSIFVNAIDTHPLAADPAFIIQQYQADFDHGLAIIAKLAPVNLCVAHQSRVTSASVKGVTIHEFSGPHPAGLSGTHIHFIDPVSANKTVWTINYQEVIAIGKLMTTGKLWPNRVISLAGPIVNKPRLVTVALGASITQLIEKELNHPNEKSRAISGSILGGRHAKNAFAFLGRHHLQISCIAEAERPEFLDYVRPTGERFSAMNLFFSKLFKRKLNLTTNTEGEPRNMVPFGNYELIMPLDILPTQLLRALIIGDTEMAQNLGCLELDEEDLALCSYVCAGKYEYGPILRAQLARIEVEG